MKVITSDLGIMKEPVRLSMSQQPGRQYFMKGFTYGIKKSVVAQWADMACPLSGPTCKYCTTPKSQDRGGWPDLQMALNNCFSTVAIARPPYLSSSFPQGMPVRGLGMQFDIACSLTCAARIQPGIQAVPQPYMSSDGHMLL